MRWVELFEKLSLSKLDKYLTKEDVLLGFELEFIARGYPHKIFIPEKKFSRITEIAEVFRKYCKEDPDLTLSHYYTAWLMQNPSREADEKEWIAEQGFRGIINLLQFKDNVEDVYLSNREIVIELEGSSTIQRKKLARDLERYLPVPLIVLDDYHDKAKDFNYWYLEPDRSITVDDEKTDIGAELVTPAFESVDFALEQLKMLLNVIEKIGYTNDSTALHVNISFTEKKDINPLKLVLLLGESYVAKIFGREVNKYAQQQLVAVLDKLAKDKKAFERIQQAKETNDFKTMELIFDAIVTNHKYRSVHFKRDYLEFRIIGGKDYHKKYEDIKSSIARFLYAMTAASDKEMGKRSYLKKLAKLISTSKEWIIGSNKLDGDDIHEKAKKDLILFNNIPDSSDIKKDVFYHQLKNLLNMYYNFNDVSQDSYDDYVFELIKFILSNDVILRIVLEKLDVKQVRILHKIIKHSTLTRDNIMRSLLSDWESIVKKPHIVRIIDDRLEDIWGTMSWRDYTGQPSPDEKRRVQRKVVRHLVKKILDKLRIN